MPFGRKRAGLDSKLKLFSLDLHFAVIADVKHTLRAIYGSDVHVTDWLLYHQCPSKYGFQKPARSCDDLKASEAGAAYQTLNNITWYAIDQGMVDRWVWTYRAELARFDGFIVTHSPVFARLFELANKPIILVNSCRYDQPYCVTGDMDELSNLNKSLKTLNDRGLLIPISNNKADQEYLRLGTGVESFHLPSLCLYTNVTVDTEAAQQHEPALYIGNFRHASSRLSGLPPAVVQQLADAGLEFQKSDADAKSEPQSWHTLYHRKAIVHFPYEISTMSIFEQYSAGVVLLFPSRRFFEEMMQNSLAEQDGKPAITDSGSLRSLTSVYWKQSTATFRLRLSPHELHQLPAFAYLADKVKHTVEQEGEDIWAYTFGDPERIIPDTLRCTMDPRWWLDRADYYDPDWMPGIKLFDSWEHLINLLQEEPDMEERRRHLDWIAKRSQMVYAKWRELLQDKFPQLR